MDFGKIRRSPRLHKLCLITYVNREDGEQRTPVSVGRTLDLSKNGVRMEVFQKIPAGSLLEMEIAVGDAILSVKGRVVHVRNQQGGGAIIGVEFDTPQDKLTVARPLRKI